MTNETSTPAPGFPLHDGYSLYVESPSACGNTVITLSRTGSHYTSALVSDDQGKTWFRACTRCNGAGDWGYRSVIGRDCLRCGKSGIDPNSKRMAPAAALAFVQRSINSREKARAERVAESERLEAQQAAALHAWQAANPALAKFLEGHVGEQGFLGSLATIAEHRPLTERQTSAATKVMNERQAADAKASTSVHVGTVKVRQGWELKATRESRVFENNYGFTYLCPAEDADGNQILIKTTSHVVAESFDRSARDGHIVKGRGTVKEHSEFNGNAQTVLTRFTLED